MLLVCGYGLPGMAQTAADTEKAKSRRSTRHAIAMIGTWREVSVLRRSDGVEYKINTLNSVGRLGSVQYHKNGRFLSRYAVMLGHSENDGTVESMRYFQRSVLFAGVEGALGLPIFLSPGVELSLVLGGLLRSISHSVPSSDYKFKTAVRVLPILSLEYMWRLSSTIYWHQGVGTQGQLHDTFWSAGFGLDW
jgi:hypothetical protein